ncbi:outer membrane beta-barrel protein [Devosia sp.]|uniref:outer membrane beta-barrel protein n=1 Tax=Devosia sp. TaxID=1871048 RepID=UPI003BABBE7B
MKKLVGIVAVATLAAGFSGGAAVAADLMVQEPVMAPALADDGSVYFKVYGGAVLEDSISIYSDDYDLDAGWLFGGAVGMDVFAPGLAVELDATVSSSDINGSFLDGVQVNGVTVMADLVYTAPLTDAVSAYFGAGLGVVGVQVDGDDFGYGAGGQVFAGLSLAVADNVSLFGEVRYQGAFSTIDADGWDVDFSRTAVLAGLKFSF